MVNADLGACEWFIYELRRSNLIDRGQLDQVVEEFLRRNPRAEPNVLAEYLVRQNILTQFQADRILQNKTQGLVLGPYVLIDSIGQGSMGTVFKALSKTDNQLYAVKVLPRRSMWNVRLARRQVRSFGQFSHPGVVPFVDVGTSGGMHYLVWPLVDGETLESLVQRQGKLRPDVACLVGLQIAQGMAACQQHGLFHGLLKPSNVMVSPDMQVRILDYGIGSLLVENEGESLVDTMSTANTLTSGLDCASPESIMEPTNRTVAGDQYSLGCVLYYCLSGRYPFPEGSAVEKMMAHQFKQPEGLATVAPELPAPIVEIVEKLMQKSPEARYGSLDDLTSALQHHSAPMPTSTPAYMAAPAPGMRGSHQGAPRPAPAYEAPRPAPGYPPAPQPAPGYASAPYTAVNQSMTPPHGFPAQPAANASAPYMPTRESIRGTVPPPPQRLPDGNVPGYVVSGDDGTSGGKMGPLVFIALGLVAAALGYVVATNYIFPH